MVHHPTGNLEAGLGEAGRPCEDEGQRSQVTLCLVHLSKQPPAKRRLRAWCRLQPRMQSLGLGRPSPALVETTLRDGDALEGEAALHAQPAEWGDPGWRAGALTSPGMLT